ncbi:uncharacterized Zn finger protein (UPF0148 family) [Methanofollis sp. W23]|uniref:hypothetical protein n=1 Tax=Methanofollis sp. W23 TaxID=2817849 RepID=UPI001AE62CE0|nr:hypothetical protein [Methanofollis sp. W23]MBP2147270.1 uncharacterized Zn finger protein (UPF0148 family) [Methanofollis sp. W23]
MALCTCPKCGHAWNYRGKAVGDQYICCPACLARVKLSDSRQYERPADEIEDGVRDLVAATRHRASVTREDTDEGAMICVLVARDQG